MELDAGRPEAQQAQEVRIALAAYGLTVATCILSGCRLSIPFAYYQLLGANNLRDRLAESLVYLHAQPPLLNLGLGLALKLSDWLGVAPETLLSIGHIALGAVGIWGFARLAARLVKTAWVRWVCIGFVVFHPALYMALFQYFYTFHELVLLCLIPLAAMASLETRRLVPYALLCAETLALVYTHSLFHWIFGAAILAGVAWPLIRQGARTAGDASARGYVVCLGGALLILIAWPAKNWLLLGEFQYSSWTGYSLALELPIPAERVPTRRWDVPERFQEIPVLAERTKLDGSANWNHYSMIGRSHELGALARTTLRQDPTALLHKAQLNYWNYTRFSARNPYTGKFGTTGGVGNADVPLPALVRVWMGAYELVFYLDPRSEDALAHRAYRTPSTQSWALSGFVFAFPLLVFCALFALYRRWRLIDPCERAGVSLVLAILLWVLTATLLIDGSEANRIRFPTEPYLPLLCGWLLASRPSRSRTKPEPHVT